MEGIMKLIIYVFLFTVCNARPKEFLEVPDVEVDVQVQSEEEAPYVPQVLYDVRTQDSDGTSSFEFQTDNGIQWEQSGAPILAANNAIGYIGRFSYPLPNGEIFEMKYVADENGFQPESAYLPQPPAFPHPIPQFVLDQIEFARVQDEEEARRREEEERLDTEPEAIIFQ